MKQDPDKSRMNFPNRALKWLVILMVVFLVIEIPLLISHARHAYFKIDGWFAFYAILGFLACPALTFLARGLGVLVRRDESTFGNEDDKTLPEDLDEQLR
ncbi:MAG: hypothetical protein P1U58_03745 [Verrucomicrobiales bacterium]|nr:hypothetical protein [Verrucomicrobiales bacterium]